MRRAIVLVFILGVSPAVHTALSGTTFITDLGPVELFLGVSNSDDNGRRIDLKVELYKNYDLIGSEEIFAQQVAGNSEANCRRFLVPLTVQGTDFGLSDELLCKVSVRRSGGSGNFGVKLWYNNIPAPNKGYCRSAKVIVGDSTSGYYYLRSGNILSPENGTSGINAMLLCTIIYQSFGTWALDGEAHPLPIQLASFTAAPVSESQVRLNWTTLTEINNYGFEIQKSDTTQQQYQSIPHIFIPGHGTTNEPQQYSSIDSTATSGSWYYRLKQIDLDGSSHYSDGVRVRLLTSVEENEIPAVFSLSQNYPNPFNPSTRIRYGLPHSASITLTVYNALGQEVAQLVNDHNKAGYHEVVLRGDNLASGVYFYRLDAGSFTGVKKLLFLK